MTGIYKIFWLNCDYHYIGQSVDIPNRKKYHYNKLAKNRHANKILQNVYNKYGIPEFSIIEICIANTLTAREQFWLDIHKNNFTCNIAPIANSCFGIKRSQETRDKLRLINLGSTKSIETRLKISERKKHLTERNRENLRNGQKGKTQSVESNNKRRIAMLNISQEYKDRMSISTSGDRNGRAKLVVNLQTGIYYGSAKSAYIDSGLKYDLFKMMLNGGTKNRTNFIYA